MGLSLQINRDDSRAVYLQIAAQIRNLISVGRLPPGTRLPSVRTMAQSLDVNRLTVHNAYSELQADGWVESTVGRGTFVVEQAQPMTMLSSLTHEVSADSVLYDIRPLKQIPTLRSLAYSEPDPALVPTDEIFGNFMALRRDAANLLRYDSPQGDPMLRVEIANLVKERGFYATPDEILVTNGAMQSLSLTSLVLAQPGDCVIVEQPTYLGFIHILDTFGLTPIPIPLGDDGPDIEALEEAIETHHPRFFYTIPGFHNPTGVSMSLEKRRQVLDIAHKHDIYIVEDDIYGVLSYDGIAPMALKAADTDERVIYISSFSKMLIPGLRVGYVIPPPQFLRQIIARRLACDLFSPSFIQRALANFLHEGRLKAHLRRVLPAYKERRDTMMRALERYMPSGVTWTRPTGGFSTWVTLPQENMMKIYEASLERSIAFTPGQAFVTGMHTNRHLRLCFSTQPPEDLTEIIAMLGEIIYRNRDEVCAGEGEYLTPLV